MGACDFFTIAKGETAAAAFHAARNTAVGEAMSEDETYEGYSGTIAEKPSFTLIPNTLAISPDKWHGLLLDAVWYWNDGVPNKRAEERHKKAWDTLVKWFGERDADRYLSIFDDKWGDALAIQHIDGYYVFAGMASC